MTFPLVRNRRLAVWRRCAVLGLLVGSSVAVFLSVVPQHVRAVPEDPEKTSLEVVRLVHGQEPAASGTAAQAEAARQPALAVGVLAMVQSHLEAGDLETALREFEGVVGPWNWGAPAGFDAMEAAGDALGRALLERGDASQALRAFSLVARASRYPVRYLYRLAGALDDAERQKLWQDTPYLFVEDFEGTSAKPLEQIIEKQGRNVVQADIEFQGGDRAARLALTASTQEGASVYAFKTPGFMLSDEPFAIRATVRQDTPCALCGEVKYWLPIPKWGADLVLRAPTSLDDGRKCFDTAREFAGIKQEIVRTQGAQGEKNFPGSAILSVGIELPPGPGNAFWIDAITLRLPENWQEVLDTPIPTQVLFKWEFTDPENPVWEPKNDIENFAVADGCLRFRTTGPEPALWGYLRDLNANYVNSIEIRMRVWPLADNEKGSFSWSFPDYEVEKHGGNPFGEPRIYPLALQGGEGFHTYRINLQEGYDLDWSGARTAFRLTPTRQPGREVEIDYIAFLRLSSSAAQELSKLTPGKIRRGVGSRPVLYTMEGERQCFPLTLDRPAFFESGITVLDYPPERGDDMVEFQVHWRAGGMEELVLRRVLPAEKPRERFGWEDVRVDLAKYTGQQGELVLSTQWSRDEQRKAPPLLAAWGAPALWKQGGPPKQNILVICCDTMRADVLGASGRTSSVSPNIDALAGESIVFEQAYAAAPWTWHSVTSLFTSLYVRQYTKARAPLILAPGYETMAQKFHQAGYATAAFSLNTWISEQTGLGRGFDYFYDLVTSFDLAMQGVHSERATEPVMRWLDRHHEEPFFMYVHYLDPHAPWEPPAWTRGRCASEPEGIAWMARNGKGDWVQHSLKTKGEMPVGESDVRYLKGLYDEEVLGVDEHVGRILDSLERWGLKDNTTVVLLSDHGEEFMEHGFLGHGAQNYEEQLRVPLMIRVPGMAPKRVTQLASLIDVAPTLLALAGCEPLTNASGLNLLEPDGRALQERHGLLAELLDYREPQQFAFITREWKYLHWIGEQERKFTRPPANASEIELYSRQADPHETHNLAPEMPEVAKQLEEQAAAFMAELDQRGTLQEQEGSDMGLSDGQIGKLEALGYL